MKVTFIRPNMYPRRSRDAMQPLCFAILKSLTPPDIETAFYDERLEEIPFDEDTDLVAMTVETYTARRSFQIASEFEQRGVPVVMGGYHPTFLPDECLQFSSAIVRGDAEGVWPSLIADARTGNLQTRYQDDGFPKLGGQPTPDRSIFAGKRYAPIALVQYGRGCKYSCDFCSIRAFYGSSLRQRPLDRFISELEQINRRHVFIVDDNIFTDITKAKALFHALIPLKIKWSCQVSIDIARDPELVALMAKSGCLTALVGFESLEAKNLKQMRKQWNTKHQSYADAIKVFQDSGIMLYGTFVFGYDNDDADSFERTVEFAINHRFYLANFNPLTPTPGSKLFDRMKREGRLLYDRWWLDRDYRYGQAIFEPRGMTAEQLTEGCYRARKMFNTWSSITKRSLAVRTNLRTPYRAGIYYLSNLISKREIRKKQLSPLGILDHPATPLSEFRMKITFIKPNIGKMLDGVYIDEGRMEPLMLGVLAGLTPPDVECVIYDDRMEEIPYDDPTDLVAITVEIYTARRSYEIAAEFRARGVKVILGGVHTTLHPEESAAHADSIYLGDAEFRWEEAVEDARKGELKPIYEAPAGVPQPGGVQPRRDLFEGKGYLPMTLMQYSRGCRFVCDFCAISAYFKRRQYIRPTREILDEIENQGRKMVFFVDDNFLSDQKAAKEFLRELIPMKINWVSQASIDMTKDLELMALLKESGCLGNVIGFESINPDNIKQMKKVPNASPRGWDQYQKHVDILRDHNLLTWASFTLGHDHDTVQSIKETYDFAMHHKFTFAAFNILMPYPGTPLYDRLKEEGRLLYDGQWWLHPDYRFNDAAFVPSLMSPDELTEAVWECRKRWNRLSSMFYRFWDFKTHLHCLTRMRVYKYYVPIFAKEAFKKQGMLFGHFRNRIFPKKPKANALPAQVSP